ncbi:PH domain-containing protein [Saccharomonospora azurea]|uniref:PH domain-containing protein n=1 Tax=Saccharomonospora azurea TaxID=40988 RepID=UPI0024096958|nr:PH domain-containing protein [Saccharomonospora azurea]
MSATTPRRPENLVHRKAIAWWTLRAALIVVPIVATPAVLAVLIADARTWLLLATGVLGVLGLLLVLIEPRWRYRVHRWELTSDAVYTSAGWIWREWRVAPMSRVQTVDTARGPLEQLFGLASVTVTTASAAGPVRIKGLEHAVARDVAEQLTARAQLVPGDAA